MSDWDLTQIRKLAGVPLVESWADDDYSDDDEDPDVKIAMGDKRQKDFETKNKKQISAASAEAAEKAQEAKKKASEKKAAEKPAAKAEEKPAEKKEEKAEEKPAEKKEEKAADQPKRRGKAPNENSKSGGMRSWLASNPGATRGQFIAAAAERGMSKHHANTYFYQLKKKSAVTEGFILTHPMAPSYVLAENAATKRPQWIDVASEFEPMFFETEGAAQQAAKNLNEWQGQHAVIEKVQFDV